MLIDVFFPRRCAHCTMAISHGVFCELCTSAIHAVDNSVCAHGQIQAAFVYGGIVRDLILLSKFKSDQAKSRLLTRHLSFSLAHKLLNAPFLNDEFDYVTFVPTHWQRRLKRGHEFPGLLAQVLAKALNSRFADLLICTKLAEPLSASKSAATRLLAIQGRFALSNSKLKPSRILLVDDVTTTGATLSACSAALEACGHSVSCFAFAKTMLVKS